MKKSKDKRVQEFLDDIDQVDIEKSDILQKLRDIVFENYPKVAERIMYGGIMFSLEDDFAGIFAYKNHVSFEFGVGYQFNDPKKLLEGKGEFRRHLKLRSVADIKDKQVAFFVKQAN